MQFKGELRVEEVHSTRPFTIPTNTKLYYTHVHCPCTPIPPLQFKGELRVEEVHSTGDEDDYVYSVTADGSGANQVRNIVICNYI